ncbi:MAG: NAD(P)/FAD-dependent oxidoreductase [Alkaliphilus sp.]
MIYDLIVVGGGPSGIFAAINFRGKKILLLEAGNKLGKKLLLSGAGQCNITNDGESKDFHGKYGDKDKFVKRLIRRFDNKSLMNFFTDAGLELITKEDGRVLPKSLISSDVVSLLLKKLMDNEVEIKCNERVESVRKIEDNFYSIKTSENKYQTANVVIATGGCLFAEENSINDGCSILKDLEHTIVEPEPALTPLYVNNHFLYALSGTSLENASLTIWKNGKLVKRVEGDLLITHKGFSGPLILDSSRHFHDTETIVINFLGEKINKNDLEEIIIRESKISGKTKLATLLNRLGITKNLAYAFLTESIIETDIRCSELDKNKRKKIAKQICEYSVRTFSSGGFDVAMVTAGGLSLDQVNMKTMESKHAKGLYIVGETLDLDGDTGGYNIQMAFTTGIIAAEDLNSKL